MADYSQHGLGNEFGNGAEQGTASNVMIQRDSEGWTHLVGYGWAIYASRSPAGSVVFFDGWRGYSTSTTIQLSKLASGVTDVAYIDVLDDEVRPEEHREAREMAQELLSEQEVPA